MQKTRVVCCWWISLSLQMRSNNEQDPIEVEPDISLNDDIFIPIHNENVQELPDGTHPTLEPATHPTSTEVVVQEGSLPVVSKKRNVFEAWDHFIKRLDLNPPKVECRHCKARYAYGSVTHAWYI